MTISFTFFSGLGYIPSTLLPTCLQPTDWKVAQPGCHPGRADSKAGTCPLPPKWLLWAQLTHGVPHKAHGSRAVLGTVQVRALCMDDAQVNRGDLYTIMTVH